MMDNKEIEKRLKDIWGQIPDYQPEDKIEASWKDFSSKIFNTKKKHLKLWHYATAAVFVIFLSVSSFWMYTTNSKNFIANTVNVIKNPSVHEKIIYLPDSSLVELEPHSQLKFVDNFINNRKIQLQGEAFFDVKKDKEHPFQVSCQNTTTTVLGTEFTIKEDLDKTVSVKLYEGSVQMSIKNNKNNWILSPGEKFVYDQKKLSVRAFKLFKDFNNKPLSEVIQYIQENYNYKIILPKDLLKKKTTIHIRKKEKLANIINIIAEIYKLTPYINKDLKQIKYSKKRKNDLAS